MNGNADLMSRLPLPATEADNHPDARLSDPADIDVYFIGASGVRAAHLMEPTSSSLREPNELDPEFIFTVGERELRTAPPTANEESAFKWQVIQSERNKQEPRKVEKERKFAVPDNTPLVQPTSVVSGQWDSGVMLHACPITEEGQRILGLKENQQVTVINSQSQ